MNKTISNEERNQFLLLCSDHKIDCRLGPCLIPLPGCFELVLASKSVSSSSRKLQRTDERDENHRYDAENFSERRKTNIADIVNVV